MNFEKLRQKYLKLYEAMKEWHRIAPRPHRGHGLDHDVTVAMLAVKIAPDERTAELGFIAGLLHSIDRTVERGNKQAVEDKVLEMFTHFPEDITSDERGDILLTVLNHSDLNKDDQPLVQQVLMDADRLANLMILVMIRAGQFQPELPPIEFNFMDRPNPKSTYRDPCSIIDDMRGCLSQLGEGHVGYIEQIRVPKAQILGAYYHGRLNSVVEMIREDHEKLGLSGIEL